MKTQTGVWLDMSGAHIVHIKGDDVTSSQISSGIDTHERFKGEGNQASRFGDQAVNAESHKEHRIEHQTKDFLNNIKDSLSESNEIVIFGPAQMKVELEKLIKSDHKLAKCLVGVESADNMTDNQKTAWVRDYYGKSAPRK